MKTMKILMVIFICISLAFLSAQTPTEKQKTRETEKKEPMQAEEKEAEAPGDAVDEITTGEFVYQPKGRRDPFWNLLLGKSVKAKREAKEGIAGMLIEELELEGILYKQGKYIALFKGPDGKPYDVRVGDSVYDGEVIKIDINSVVFKRILTIALGGTKEKIITKYLTPEEEAKIQ
ncbi:MAG: pilus assembly protein PilP [Candidatus Aminicenantes bacterium]|nr:MAG: pilus assembly protein PilP [Candidatus Aminicenantes bacterium]